MFETDHNYGRSIPVAPTREESALLLSRVSFLTVGAVLVTALGAALTWNVTSLALVLGALVGTFVMLFVCRAVAHRYPINLAALAVFALLEGMVFGPALRIYANVNGPLIIVQAAVLATVIFTAVGALGYTSSRSYAHWLPWLFGGLILLLVVGVVMIFVNLGSTANWLWSVGGALLFVAFTFVDFTRIRHNYGAHQYIEATMEVYLDLINLFWFILRLLSRRD